MPEPNNEPLHVEAEMLQTGGTPSLAAHIWKQRGPYLVCVSCPHEHAVGVGAFGADPTDVFQGIGEDGKPRFKRFR